MRRGTNLAAMSGVIGGLALATALSQIPPDSIRSIKQGPRLQVNAAKIELLRKPKIAYLPFQLRHPITGKAISREEFIDLPAMGKLPGERAKKVQAGKFFDQLNKLEKEFNDLGYSLRSAQDNVIVQKSRIDRGALVRVANTAKSQHLRFDPSRMAKMPTLLDFKGKRLGPPTLAPGVPRDPDTSPRYDKSFRYEAGDPDIFSGFVRGALKADGSRAAVTVNGDFAIGATMFKKGADILRMSGAMSSPGAGPLSGRVELTFLGFVIHSFKRDTSTPFIYDSEYSKPFREKIVPIQFMLGPVPMTGEVGIVGLAGIKYGISLAPLDATGLLAPFGNVGVYAEIGTGIDICSLGVGADLILIEDRVEFVGRASVKDVTTPQPYLMLSVSGTNVLEMLAGRLYFYVKIPVPTWKPPFWKKKKYDWEVFDWEGMKVEGVLFNQSKRVNL